MFGLRMPAENDEHECDSRSRTRWSRAIRCAPRQRRNAPPETGWPAPRRPTSRTRSSSRRSRRHRPGSPSRSRLACSASAVSGMLSNTAETKPRPSATVPRGVGQLLHGHHRRRKHQRQQEDAAADGAGHLFPVRPAQRDADQDGEPDGGADEREPVGDIAVADVDDDVDGDRRDQDGRDDALRAPSRLARPAGASLGDRRIAVLLERRGNAEDRPAPVRPPM